MILLYIVSCLGTYRASKVFVINPNIISPISTQLCDSTIMIGFVIVICCGVSWSGKMYDDDDDDKEVEKKKYVQVSKLLIEMTFCLITNFSFSASSSGQIIYLLWCRQLL